MTFTRRGWQLPGGHFVRRRRSLLLAGGWWRGAPPTPGNDGAHHPSPVGMSHMPIATHHLREMPSGQRFHRRTSPTRSARSCLPPATLAGHPPWPPVHPQRAPRVPASTPTGLPPTPLATSRLRPPTLSFGHTSGHLWEPNMARGSHCAERILCAGGALFC